MTTKHKPATPLPWTSSSNDPNKNPYWYSTQILAFSAGVAELNLHNRHSQGKDNAEYIIAACNAYQQLSADNARLREALRVISSGLTNGQISRGETLRDLARAALNG